MYKKKAVWTRVYIPRYTYSLPDGNVLEFEGHPQQEKPYVDAAGPRSEFRIYMVKPEDTSDGRYILTENQD